MAVAMMLLGSFCERAAAQLNPAAAQYFVNQYIANPAFAGAGKGSTFNGTYRALWTSIPGAPVSQNLTAEYGFEKVGIGLSLFNERSGLLGQTRVVATYAYHLPLSESQSLHFGVSGGFLAQRLDNGSVKGSAADPMIGMYNTRKTYIDGDLGVAYTGGRLTAQFALPNLKTLFERNEITVSDQSSYYAALAYRFDIGSGIDGVVVEPKAALRGVRGNDDIWDAGVQVGIADRQVFFTGLYHSTESFTAGLGMDFRRRYLISALYTSQTAKLNGYANGGFELSLRVLLPR